jgi:AAA+ ATPase superfamily predicted ATPase
MEDPVCGIGKQARYIFDDPFFSFYYRFVFENRSRLELGRSEAVWEDIDGALGEYVGREFERVAREALMCLNGTSWKGVRIDFDEIGRWWNRPGEEIDVVAAGKGEVIAGEVKWSASPMRLDVFSRLQQKVKLIERLNGLPVRCLLVSRGGFDAELRREAEKRAALLLDMSDLEEIFSKGHGKPK